MHGCLGGCFSWCVSQESPVSKRPVAACHLPKQETLFTGRPTIFDSVARRAKKEPWPGVFGFFSALRSWARQDLFAQEIFDFFEPQVYSFENQKIGQGAL